MQLTKIAMNPWDFTLYSTEDGSRIMKVMFSEGEYKVDIARFFLVAKSQNDIDASLDELKKLADGIRTAYPEVAYPEIKKADVVISK
jgi:hypothetical protein